MTSHLQKLNKSCKTKTSRSLVFIKNEENPKHVFNNEKSNKEKHKTNGYKEKLQYQLQDSYNQFKIQINANLTVISL